ncbi:MAG: hypothetical protein H6811_00930 [Phycisphaeraceae bacterium]|nr:hypothetical protein [Phycisphaeraceae bacterium]
MPNAHSLSVPGGLVRNPSTPMNILVACAVVAMAYWLGASWLASPVLGVPSGLYAVALVFALLRWGDLPLSRMRSVSRLASSASSPLSNLGQTLSSIPHRVACAMSAAVDAWRTSANDDDLTFDDDEEDNDGSEADRGPSQSGVRSPMPRRISVALALHSQDVRRLLDAGIGRAIEWVAVDPNTVARGLWTGIRNFDAIVQRDGALVSISRPNASDSIHPWGDWSEAPASVCYPGVFPMRLDAPRVTLGELDLASSADRDLLLGAIETFAVGRAQPGSLLAVGGEALSLEDSVRRLIDAASVVARSNPQALGVLGAARAASAGMMTHACDPEQRLPLVSFAPVVVPDEPESHFRHAAALFAATRDDDAFEALRNASAALASCPRPIQGDQTAFLQSEIEHGDGDEMALGRLASGLWLAACCIDPAQFQHLRDDVVDDLRSAPWLIGRDQDLALLLRVLREFDLTLAARQAPASHAA